MNEESIIHQKNENESEKSFERKKNTEEKEVRANSSVKLEPLLRQQVNFIAAGPQLTFAALISLLHDGNDSAGNTGGSQRGGGKGSGQNALPKAPRDAARLKVFARSGAGEARRPLQILRRYWPGQLFSCQESRSLADQR